MWSKGAGPALARRYLDTPLAGLIGLDSLLGYAQPFGQLGLGDAVFFAQAGNPLAQSNEKFTFFAGDAHGCRRRDLRNRGQTTIFLMVSKSVVCPLMLLLDKTPLLSSDDPAEHDRLVNAASKLVGLLAAASVDGDVSLGSEIAGNAQSYNRKLHVQEEKRLAIEAKNLDASTGKSQSGFEWNALLTFVAGGEVDKQTNNELQGILSGYSPNNPEGQHLADDLRVARGVVTQLQNEKVLLTWADGSPIVANGDKVVAFTSTDRQYNDSRLFNPSSNSTYNNAPGGMGVVPDQWAEQYGDSIAIRKLPEIGALSADAGTQAEQMDRLRVLASGGVNSNIDLELLLEVMPTGKIAKGSLLAVLKELVARDTLAKAEKTVLEKRLIELNATRDAEGFGQTAQRDFVPGKEHRAENINAGQVTDRDGLPRVDDEKAANDLLLTEQAGGVKPPYWGTQRPAWKEGTIVTDKVIDQPRTMTMTINQQQYERMKAEVDSGRSPSPALGGWATDTPINSVADVRNKLAVSEEFKRGSLFQIEFTVKPGVGIREGTVGDMWDATNGVRLPGGGHQVNFMDKSPRANPELYEVNMSSVRSLQ